MCVCRVFWDTLLPGSPQFAWLQPISSPVLGSLPQPEGQSRPSHSWPSSHRLVSLILSPVVPQTSGLWFFHINNNRKAHILEKI